VRIGIVSNLSAGIGLLRDFELLRDVLVGWGHEVTGIQFDDPSPIERFDLAIFLEVTPRSFMGLSSRRWFFANPDWMKQEVITTVDRSFERVFAKTREGERLLVPLFGERVHYVGFLARDQHDVSIPRMPKFLHIGGNSSLRGTQAVVDAWAWKKNGKTLSSELIVVSTAIQDKPDIPNVTYFKWLEEQELKRLQNECLFHLQPSGTEGYGHILRESLSVGAQLITTDAPPMNEIETGWKLPVAGKRKYNLADIWEISALDIFHMVEFLTQDDMAQVYKPSSREIFLAANEEFKRMFAAHLEPPVIQAVGPEWVPRKQEGQKSIAFLGNFDSPESTENQVLWALTERLDMHVVKLQENTVRLPEVREAALYANAFLWIRTPNWLHVRDSDMLNLLQDLRDRKIPSISMHLDKYFGLPEREMLVGIDPFWLTQDVWTADGSPEAAGFFLARHVNHHWMKPAVSEVYCHPGTPRDMYRCNVLFVGARDYHPEYPFRPQLVDFLKREYDDEFQHVTGIRGHQLNDVYASARVAVGDCIFAGTPNYWSDRVPETCGRYGFLVHPQVEGLNIPCLTYKPQDLDSLHDAIEFALASTEANRRKLIQLCAEMVWDRETWECRMLDILGSAGVL
jgi:hypothetical protein